MKSYTNCIQLKQWGTGMESDNYSYRCLICDTMYKTDKELIFHNKGHGTPSYVNIEATHTFRCDICYIVFATAKELDYHDKEHATLSNPEPVRKPKRVRRKVMNVETFARFYNNLAIAIKRVVDEFDPTPTELGLALVEIESIVSLLASTTKRRTS